MHCRNCGAEVSERAEICTKCGVKPLNENKFCQECGVETKPNQEVCVNCGFKLAKLNTNSQKNKITAGLLAILLGGFGAHKFYLGKTVQGILYLIFIWTFVPEIIALVEGIIYLTSSDETFNAKYCS